MRILVLLAACTSTKMWPVADYQECSLRVEETVINRVDMLFVVDGPPARADELARIIDEQIAFDRRSTGTSYHIGVLGPKLLSGCGVDGAYVDFLQGVRNDVDPGLTIGDAVACQAASAPLAREARPMTAAANFLLGDNQGFRRPDAILAVYFLLRDAYDEDGAPLLGARPRDPVDLILGSVAPPSPSLDATVAQAGTAVQLAPDAPSWSPLLAWDKVLVETDFASACARPRDPQHPDFIVEDVGNRGDSVVAMVPACADDGWQPSCWELLDDGECAPGWLHFNVRRPPWGAPEGIFTRAVYDCALLAESR